MTDRPSRNSEFEYTDHGAQRAAQGSQGDRERLNPMQIQETLRRGVSMPHPDTSAKTVFLMPSNATPGWMRKVVTAKPEDRVVTAYRFNRNGDARKSLAHKEPDPAQVAKDKARRDAERRRNGL
jgi:hypothetical protein